MAKKKQAKVLQELLDRQLKQFNDLASRWGTALQDATYWRLRFQAAWRHVSPEAREALEEELLVLDDAYERQKKVLNPVPFVPTREAEEQIREGAIDPTGGDDA